MYLVEIAFAKSKECSVLYYFFLRDTFPAGQKERERWGKNL